MFDCRITSVRMKVLQLECGLMQMGLSQFFVFNSYIFLNVPFVKIKTRKKVSPCYCKYTVCTRNKLRITDLDVTFDFKVFVCSV